MVGVHWGSLPLLLPHHVHFVNNRLLRWFSHLIKMPPVLGGDNTWTKNKICVVIRPLTLKQAQHGLIKALQPNEADRQVNTASFSVFLSSLSLHHKHVVCILNTHRHILNKGNAEAEIGRERRSFLVIISPCRGRHVKSHPHKQKQSVSSSRCRIHLLCCAEYDLKCIIAPPHTSSSAFI